LPAPDSPSSFVPAPTGINNAVSRTAGLLAIAVLGLIMFHAFSNCLDLRLNQLHVTAEVREALNTQRVKLAAAELPPNIDQATRDTIKQAIDECFVSGFRRVMICGAVLAFASSLIAFLIIRTR
jgi:hypothetical protein